MCAAGRDILIGIDAGTSVIKAVAFSPAGEQLAVASTPNTYSTLANGGAVQDMARTWQDCAATLRLLAEQCDNLAERTLGLAVTAQGDGTWLVGAGNAPVTEGWIWLDARAGDLVDSIRGTQADRERYKRTATGLNACQMGAHLIYLDRNDPDLLKRAETAMHPKDWLFLNLTDMRATDPSEAVFTFGNFAKGDYDDTVIESLGLSKYRHLMPPIVDGSKTVFPLTGQAAAATGLLTGTPVSLGFVDVVCTAIGAGIFTRGKPAGCSIVGSTGMHMKACTPGNVALNDDLTGYVMQLPIDGMVAQMQSNMAATLNIDWILDVARGLLGELAPEAAKADLVARLEGWLAAARPGEIIYHPYISDAGERGPFVDPRARAGFTGLCRHHGFADMVRAIVEGLALAGRDCYTAMGDIPQEIRISGGAARSSAVRGIFASALARPVRHSRREEAGAAGVAMMAAVACGVYDDMPSCIEEWVSPLLHDREDPDAALVPVYADLFKAYKSIREGSPGVWAGLASLRTGGGA